MWIAEIRIFENKFHPQKHGKSGIFLRNFVDFCAIIGGNIPQKSEIIHLISEKLKKFRKIVRFSKFFRMEFI